MVSWDLARLNVGNAMNLETGVFTAPRDGVYHFAYSGMKDRSTDAMYIQLRLNGDMVGNAYGAWDNNVTSSSIHARFHLVKGDRVDMWLKFGVLYDTSFHYTSFTGWLDEEYIQL